MTVLPRAANSFELARIRSDNQSSRLYLSFFTPNPIYMCRVATAPTSGDSVFEVAYDSGIGTHTDIMVDQTVLVSGVDYGLSDKGICRVRALAGLGATSGTLRIGEVSDILFGVGDYLTIQDDFIIQSKAPRQVGTTLLMDYDIAYVDQHSHCEPVPVMGMHQIAWADDTNSATVQWDGSQSWSINNTITSYQWLAPGSTLLQNGTTATPTIDYTGLGWYRVGLTLFNSDGAGFTGYRRVCLVNEDNYATDKFQLINCAGNYRDGGWSFTVRMYEDADLTQVQDRAMVILHRRDWYGDTEAEDGYVAGNQNVEAIGWIAGESIRWVPEDQPSYVEFTVYGAQYWLNKNNSLGVDMKDRTSAPTKWTRWFGLTVKDVTWHILHWRSTATRCIDVYPCSNQYRAQRLEAPSGQSIWQQLKTILNNNIIAAPCCDSLSRLFMQVEQNVLTTTERNPIPTVMTLTKNDWTNQISFDRRIVGDISQLNLSGKSWNGTAETSFYALAPGHLFSRYGAVETRENLVVNDDQVDVTTLAAAYYGWRNNPYPNFSFDLASNFHLIDLAPYQYLEVDIAAGDTPRGFAHTNMRLIPRSIQRIWNEGGYLTTRVEVEAESPQGNAIVGDTPQDPPVIPATTPPPVTPPPVPVPVPSGNAREAWFATPSAIYWSGDFFGGGQPTWNQITSIPGTLDEFNVSQSGASLYVRAGGVIYQCTNPKAITPIWNQIAYAGLNTGIGTISIYFSYTLGPMMISGNSLVTTAHTNLFTTQWVYGEYNGSAWSWSNESTANCFQPGLVGLDSWTDCNGNLYTGSHVFIENFTGAITGTNHAWHRTGGARYVALGNGSATNLRIATVGNISIGAYGANYAENTRIRGAVAGPHVYCVSGANQGLYLSDDGTTFNNVFTWQNGWVNDAQSAGGGSLAWFPLSVLSGNELCRISNNRGAAWSAMTGNFWSLTTGNQTLVGCGLVY